MRNSSSHCTITSAGDHLRARIADLPDVEDHRIFTARPARIAMVDNAIRLWIIISTLAHRLGVAYPSGKMPYSC